MAHTPGPWIVEKRERACDSWHIRPVGAYALASVYPQCDSSDNKPYYDVAANATLIAAAPDLLAALGEVIDLALFLKDDYGKFFFPDAKARCDDVLPRAEAALAAAEGETP